MESKLDQVKRKGYLFAQHWPDMADLLSLLGAHQVRNDLKPQDHNFARKNTLSSRFGLRTFPFHTDRVTDIIPPNFVCLRFKGSHASKVAFNLIDVKDLLNNCEWKEKCLNALFCVRNGPKSFVSAALQKVGDEYIFRFNPVIMSPLNQAGREVVDRIVGLENVQIFFPDEGSSIIFDNYRFVHSRGEVDPEVASHRKVERTWIYT